MGKAPKISEKSNRKKKREEEDVVDYAAVDDSYAGHGSDDDEDDDDEYHGGSADEEEEEDQEEGSGDEQDGASRESGSDEEGNQEGSSDDDEDASRSSDSDDDEEEDDDNMDDPPDRGQPVANVSKSTKSVSGSHAEPCTFDLRNLLAMNTHQVDTVALYRPPRKVKKPSSATDDSIKPITIPGESMPAVANEDELLRMATDGCSQLIAALWQLPVERSDAGPLVTLPSYDELRIPRALPPPPPKQETKWEKFAKERGIALNKNKRSQKVWDEATQSWMYRHGYNKANDSSKEWPIMEIKEGQDPYQDPWQAQREAKRAKVDKNTENQLKNQERAGMIPKGTANKVIKGKAKVRQAGIAGGNLDRDLPSGVPVDLPRTKGGDGNAAAAAAPRPSHRGKKSTVDALTAVQRSTASLGKFDKMREGEPERKKSLASLKKRKYESATDKTVLSSEAERGMKVLKAVVDGGGAAKERAIKKGKLAKGETAYDYDYSDGLGASSFRKKKGRAGAGKMKKMTKKRVK